MFFCHFSAIFETYALNSSAKWMTLWDPGLNLLFFQWLILLHTLIFNAKQHFAFLLHFSHIWEYPLNFSAEWVIFWAPGLVRESFFDKVLFWHKCLFKRSFFSWSWPYNSVEINQKAYQKKKNSLNHNITTQISKDNTSFVDKYKFVCKYFVEFYLVLGLVLMRKLKAKIQKQPVDYALKPVNSSWQ